MASEFLTPFLKKKYPPLLYKKETINPYSFKSIIDYDGYNEENYVSVKETNGEYLTSRVNFDLSNYIFNQPRINIHHDLIDNIDITIGGQRQIAIPGELFPIMRNICGIEEDSDIIPFSLFIKPFYGTFKWHTTIIEVNLKNRIRLKDIKLTINNFDYTHNIDKKEILDTIDYFEIQKILNKDKDYGHIIGIIIKDLPENITLTMPDEKYYYCRKGDYTLISFNNYVNFSKELINKLADYEIWAIYINELRISGDMAGMAISYS